MDYHLCYVISFLGYLVIFFNDINCKVLGIVVLKALYYKSEGCRFETLLGE
jgi:hypothetical protein